MSRPVPQQAIALYDAYAHKTLDRRSFLIQLTQVMGSAAGAAAVLPLIEPGSAHAQTVSEADPAIRVERVSVPADEITLSGYLAQPVASEGPVPAVMVIHENRGLNAHIEDVTRRLARAGYLAFAPDFLSRLGGTPQDPDAARTLIYQLTPEQAQADGLAGLAFLRTHPASTGRTAAMGFGWGGGMVNAMAVNDPALNAGVVFYGSSPAPEDVAQIRAALLLHYAGLDDRINADVPAFVEALESAGISHEMYTYDDVNHAFFNDTSQARYDNAAAALAWDRTLAFLQARLSGGA